jgi:hypothetical protein
MISVGRIESAELVVHVSIVYVRAEWVPAVDEASTLLVVQSATRIESGDQSASIRVVLCHEIFDGSAEELRHATELKPQLLVREDVQAGPCYCEKNLWRQVQCLFCHGAWSVGSENCIAAICSMKASRRYEMRTARLQRRLLPKNVKISKSETGGYGHVFASAQSARMAVSSSIRSSGVMRCSRTSTGCYSLPRMPIRVCGARHCPKATSIRAQVFALPSKHSKHSTLAVILKLTVRVARLETSSARSGRG